MLAKFLPRHAAFYIQYTLAFPHLSADSPGFFVNSPCLFSLILTAEIWHRLTLCRLPLTASFSANRYKKMRADLLLSSRRSLRFPWGRHSPPGMPPVGPPCLRRRRRLPSPRRSGAGRPSLVSSVAGGRSGVTGAFRVSTVSRQRSHLARMLLLTSLLHGQGGPLRAKPGAETSRRGRPRSPAPKDTPLRQMLDRVGPLLVFRVLPWDLPRGHRR